MSEHKVYWWPSVDQSPEIIQSADKSPGQSAVTPASNESYFTVNFRVIDEWVLKAIAGAFIIAAFMDSI